MVSPRYKTCDIEQFDRHRAVPVNAGAVVGLASLLQWWDAALWLVVGQCCAGACTRYVKVADGSIRVYRGEREVAWWTLSDCAVQWLVDGRRTYFRYGVGQAVERRGFARGRLAHEGDKRIAWHVAVIEGEIIVFEL